MCPQNSSGFFLKKIKTIFQDILDELILYVHDGGEITVDSFSLTVTDGNFTDTHRVPVIIGLINDETPRVTINRGLRVHAGETFS